MTQVAPLAVRTAPTHADPKVRPPAADNTPSTAFAADEPPSPMQTFALHPPTLLAAAGVALLLASGGTALVAFAQRLKRGVWWWLGANGALAAALLLAAMAWSDLDAVREAALSALALQWPVVTLTGLRRFYARGTGGVPPWLDAGVLGLGLLAGAGAALVPIDGVSTGLVLAVALWLSTAYLGWAVSRLEDYGTTRALRGLLAGLVCSCVAQAAWLGLGAAWPALAAPALVPMAALLCTFAAALLMPQLSLVMNHERSLASLKASHRKLRHLVDVDPLTRLPNRRHFQDLATRTMKEQGVAGCLLVFDIDRLKHLNDLLGHAVGDEALRQVGTVLRETLRRRDVAGRIGGDEFAALLPKSRLADTELVIQRIRKAVDDRQVAPRIARVVLNVGAVEIEDNEPVAEALRRAELQLEQSRDAARREDAIEATQPLVARAGAVAAPLAAVAPAPGAPAAAAAHTAATAGAATSGQTPHGTGGTAPAASAPPAAGVAPTRPAVPNQDEIPTAPGHLPRVSARGGLNMIPVGEVVGG